MESMYKTLLFHDVCKCVAEYLDNTLVKYETKHQNIVINHRFSIIITFKMRGNNNIEVVLNASDMEVCIVINTNAFSFEVFSKVQIIELISPVILKVKQGDVNHE